jgi:hypothetical protein
LLYGGEENEKEDKEKDEENNEEKKQKEISLLFDYFHKSPGASASGLLHF